MTNATITRRRNAAAKARKAAADRTAALVAACPPGEWIPANGGTETPFMTRTGHKVTYMWQPSTGAHAHYSHTWDMFLDREQEIAILGY